MKDSNKYYNEKSEVAILYSPEFGGGWSTWAGCEKKEDTLKLLTDSVLVELAIKQKRRTPKSNTFYDAEKRIKELGIGDIYMGGWYDIDIRFLPPGTKFRIHEYDGAESVITYEEENWFET